MQQLFLQEAAANKVFPVGAGLWTRLHPEDRIKVPYTHWNFDSTTTRLPEFAAPGLGRESNGVALDIDVGAEASGVLYALGGVAGGLTLYVDKGRIVYEYNMMMIERTTGHSPEALAPGRHHIVVATKIAKPAGAADMSIVFDGKSSFDVVVPRTVAGAFSANETLDVGTDLGSPVSLDYFDHRPCAFNGQIEAMAVDLQ